MTKIISFLSDFGSIDGYPAACKGVIETAFPEAKVFDICHSINPFDIRHGAFVLSATVPYFPVSVHFAVVDPGVGSHRKIVILETERGDYMVGPDNGLLMPAAAALGSVKRAFHLSKRFSPPGSPLELIFADGAAPTFQARDIMSPAVAALAAGVDPEEMAAATAADALAAAPWSEPRLSESTIEAEAINIDYYGTIRTNITAGAWSKLGVPADQELTITLFGRRLPIFLRKTFADADIGDFLVLVDSSNFVAIAANQGNAAQSLRVVAGDAVKISW